MESKIKIEQFEAIIENVSFAILILNKNGQVIRMNPQAIRIFGQTFSEMQGISNEKTKYFDANGNQILLEEISAFRLINGKGFEEQEIITIEHSEGRSIMGISTSPIYDQEGDLSLVVVCAHDVTKIILSKNELNKKKELLEVILDNMSEAFAVYDKDGKNVLNNAAARKMYPAHKKAKTIGGLHAKYEYLDMDENPISHNNLPTNRALRGETVKNEIILIKGNNREQITQINASPFYDKNNNLIFVGVFHNDITEIAKNQKLIKDQQEQMLKAEKEKNEALEKAILLKDEFLSLMSHEFRTPITVIHAAIQAIERTYKNTATDKMQKYLDMIKQNTYRQLRLINNLLDVSRNNAGYMRLNLSNIDIVFITKAIIESVRFYAKKKGIELSFITTFKSKIIGLDEEKYERILLNLLSNAMKYTPAGKHIYVSISSVKGFIKIEVKDEGIGIPKDKQEFIFERFGQVNSSFSRQAEGTGIGLSLVKMLIKALGGSISVQSEVGKGSVFTFLLPANKVKEDVLEKHLKCMPNNRLIQTIVIEFSDIYLTNYDDK